MGIKIPVDQEPSGSLHVADLARLAQATTPRLRMASETARTQSILAIQSALIEKTAAILAANREDVEDGRRASLSAALLDRLTLTPARITALAASLETIASSPAVVGAIEQRSLRPDGLEILKTRIPLGVIGVIFESRPNVLIDCAALAIKSGNAILLKGGSDAGRSNAILGSLVRAAIAPFLPADSIQVIPAGDRRLTLEMVQLNGLIDLIIPRGGEGLIRMVQENARIPVIAHAKGLCHLYIHADADVDQAIAITMNAKTQRPGVCNAVETLLVHDALAKTLLPPLMAKLLEAHVQLRVEQPLLDLYPQLGLTLATPEDWDMEYLDLILSIKLVPDEDAAIAHIQKYGSHHTEAIVARDSAVIGKFETAIDASCIAVNASTRFNDGGELGLGAEIGISTSKLHAYGPMGARELTTSRYVLHGSGHCRR